MKCEMSTPTNRMPQIRQSFAQAEHALLTRAVSNLGHGGGHGHGHGQGRSSKPKAKVFKIQAHGERSLAVATQSTAGW